MLAIRPAALALLLAAAPALAAEVAVPAPRDGADLTVYAGDLALVRERRSFRLPAAEADLAFAGVSGRLQPETALLQVLDGGALRVVEQRFDFDTVSPQRLLESAVGGEVMVITTNPATGRDEAERARVISVADGLVLEIGGKIHTAAPGRIVFDRMPDGLRAAPALVASVEGTANRETEAELSYLTGGITWRADYVAQYDADAGLLDLTGWASVTNTSGVDFDNARLRLVAGEVNRAAPEPKLMRAMAERAAVMSAPAADAQGFAQESFAAFHLYSLARATTLANNETKQLALLSGAAIPVTQEYVSRGQAFYFFSPLQGQRQESNADSVLSFRNDAAAKLGMPLPAGVVRVYGQDAEGAPRFMGEDGIGHTAEGGTVRVRLGRDFDIPVVREQTNYVRASDTITLTVWRVTVRNAKDKPVTVRIEEPMQGQWEITRESHPHAKPDAATAAWMLEVPAKGETVLEYNIRSQF